SNTDPVPNRIRGKVPAEKTNFCSKPRPFRIWGFPPSCPAPQQVLGTSAGHHRFSWDLHYDPIGGGGGGRGGGAGGAVPHRTYPGVNSPWVAPGTYNVRLTVDGKTSTQPIVVKIDPRVRVTPAIQQIFTLTTQMEDGARAAAKAESDIKAAANKMQEKPSAANDALIKDLDALTAGGGGAGGGGAGGFPGGRGGGRGGRGGGGGAGAAAPPGAPAPAAAPSA